MNSNCSKLRNSSTDNCIVNGTVKRFCYQSCFNGLFMLYVLESGFGFNESAANKWSVQFKEKVREGVISISL